MKNLLLFCSVALAASLGLACQGHDHAHGDDHDHPHGEDDHAHGEDDHPHGEDDHPHGEDDHAHGEDDHGHDDHGHGHEGATEVVTLWGETTQLFVEFPALVVGEESAFAAHLTRLSDHFAIDRGTVVVELSAGGATERFSVEGPSRAGIFRPVVVPTNTGAHSLTLRLDSPAASEVHDMGEFTVFATREGADAAAEHEHEDAGEISYLLEQQWQVPFRIVRTDARPMRPNVPAFADFVSPPDADAAVTAPRDGRVVAVGGRIPSVGTELAAGDPIFALSTAPEEAGDSASLDLAVEQAEIAVDAARREVDRIGPLVEQGVVAQRRLDEANSALATAEAELRSARRRRSSLGQSQRVEAAGDRIVVPAPVAGTLAELHVAPGTWITEGQELARVTDRDRLWLDVGVPEAYVGRIESVTGAWFTLEGVQGVFELPRSALVSVGTEVDRSTRTLPVRFAVDNLRRELFAGMSTEVHLITGEPVVSPAVPADAVVDDSGTDVVYVQTGGESFVRRPVQLGVRDGGYVEVLSGVAPGDWVVVEGAYSVKLASSSTESVGHGHAH